MKTINNLTDLRNIYYHAVNTGYIMLAYDSQAGTVEFSTPNAQHMITGQKAAQWFADLDALHADFTFVPYGVLAVVVSYCFLNP